MKKARPYTILERPDLPNALQLISTHIITGQDYCKLGDELLPIPRQSLFISESKLWLGSASFEYTVIEHGEAFREFTEALGKDLPWSLESVSVEKGLSRMMARFHLDLPQQVGSTSVIPELILINSYEMDHSLRLYLALHIVADGSTILVSPRSKKAWKHIGTKPGPEDFKKEILALIEEYKTSLMFYREMNSRVLAPVEAQQIIHNSLIARRFPRWLGDDLVSDFPNLTAWDLLKAYVRTVAQKYEGTPERWMEIHQDINQIFRRIGSAEREAA